MSVFTVVVILVTLLLINDHQTVTSFTRCITYNSYKSYTSRHNNNNIHHRQQAKKNDDILIAEDNISITDVSWEEQLRREATYALLPVFFPNSTTSNNPITAELSLKRLLRKRYQKQKHQNQPSNHDDDRRSNNSARGRLAALILGTSVMRLRHWYVVVVGMVNNNNNYMLSNDTTNSSSSIPVPYPLDPSLLLPLVQNHTNKSMKGDDLICYNDSSLELLSISDNHPIEEKQQLLLVREMVDEHARYLLSSSDDSTNETLLLQLKKGIIFHENYSCLGDDSRWRTHICERECQI